jgi:hypothetical protein
MKVVLAVCINADPQIPVDECISGLREYLPLPSFNREKLSQVRRYFTISSATTFHRKDWFTARAPRALESYAD